MGLDNPLNRPSGTGVAGPGRPVMGPEILDKGPTTPEKGLEGPAVTGPEFPY